MAVTQLSLRRELARKGLHLVSAIAPLGYAAGVPRTAVVVALGGAAVAALIFEAARASHDRARTHFNRFFGHLLREHEHARWSGATWLLIAFFGLALLTPRDIAIAGMWALSIGDAAAAIVGQTVSRCRHTPAPVRKTLAGSAACFAATLFGALLIAHLSVPESVIGALSATAAEWPTSWVDDNIRIAAAVAIGIFLWRIMFS